MPREISRLLDMRLLPSEKRLNNLNCIQRHLPFCSPSLFFFLVQTLMPAKEYPIAEFTISCFSFSFRAIRYIYFNQTDFDLQYTVLYPVIAVRLPRWSLAFLPSYLQIEFYTPFLPPFFLDLRSDNLRLASETSITINPSSLISHIGVDTT